MRGGQVMPAVDLEDDQVLTVDAAARVERRLSDEAEQADEHERCAQGEADNTGRRRTRSSSALEG